MSWLFIFSFIEIILQIFQDVFLELFLRIKNVASFAVFCLINWQDFQYRKSSQIKHSISDSGLSSQTTKSETKSEMLSQHWKIV